MVAVRTDSLSRRARRPVRQRAYGFANQREIERHCRSGRALSGDQGADELVFYDIDQPPAPNDAASSWLGGKVAEGAQSTFRCCSRRHSEVAYRTRGSACRGRTRISVNSPALERPDLSRAGRCVWLECVVMRVSTRSRKRGELRSTQYNRRRPDNMVDPAPR